MPSTTTPALKRVLNAAVVQFARHGYEGASLSGIAADAGIRKASLYSHVKNKNALFLAVFEDALHSEARFARDCFARPDPKWPGQNYCESLLARYADSEHFRFLLRTAYIPPEPLFHELQEGYETYMQQLLADFTTALRRHVGGVLSDRDADIMGHAWMGMVDSLHVALIYIGQARFEARLNALEHLMGDSIARLVKG
ncbi:TetR/AcrR family transcriptional regulator [Halomonas sp. MCCC 1A11036]|uniref:TetR/AcrR family transcriptional regulator n=1 Tax=Billgrantia zhangzhouensis TaxID=2733481 RepID=A0ABS9AIC0_9GAMM|nr:TetR/AcrR family transcriptional regulator [Halomonas zhangzhouensis]MCE8021499.1 TetR/AcrR family transcriptional regulator [Halomonas zhangzhouensis]